MATAEGLAFFKSMSDLAVSLCAKFGQTATFRRYTPTTNVITGTVVPGTPATFTAIIPNLPVNNGSKESFDNQLEALTLAKKKVKYTVLPAIQTTFEPRAFDEVVIGTEVYQVLGCTDVNPAGTPIVYGIGLVLT
jgi:hypothetical protein